MCSDDSVADLNHSVLQASSNEKFIRLHIEDEVGSDRLWEILECKIGMNEELNTQQARSVSFSRGEKFTEPTQKRRGWSFFFYHN